ncbi:MAG: response regulator [Spirochaetaceae bacterium]|nr:response regulator [Spirochaetaceae bacterium]
MYSIVFVDDENQVRKTIISRIPWNDLGFEIIGEAENGLEAIDIINEKSPDLVITDIKMPYLDGLDLIKAIKEINPAISVIILSGHDEFSYARKAITLGVDEYVLKPINRDEFIELLIKLKKNLDYKFKSINDKIELNKLYNSVIPQLKQQLINEIYLGKYEENKDKISKYDLYQNKDYYICVVIDTDVEKDNLILLKFNQVLDHFFESSPIILRSILNNQIVLTFSYKCMGDRTLEKRLFEKRTFKRIDDIKSYLTFYTKVSFYIGVSQIIESFYDLDKAYIQCNVALNYKPYYEDETIFYIKDLECEYLIKLSEDSADSLIDNLLTSIKLSNSGDVEMELDALFSAETGLDPNEVQELLYRIISSLSNLTISYQLEYKKYSSIFSQINKLTTLSKIVPFLKNICISINKDICKKRESSNVKFVEKAKMLIEQNYFDKNFNLDSICEVLGVSNSYFSSTFKKETKIAFTNALTLSRIEHSKHLLESGDYKTYQVSDKVGFSDSNYFSFCFKKLENVSPTAYRKQFNKS